MTEADKYALRLVLYMPQAHWRVPFAYQRRHTLPLPPFSTVIGLLCNMLGIRNLRGDGAPCRCSRCTQVYQSLSQQGPNGENRADPHDDINAILYHELVNHLELSIAGTFKTKTTEYTWFRNLNVKSHEQRFGSPTNRVLDFTVEHPGGQQPVLIDILNDVHLIIHIGSAHNCRCFLELLEYAFTHDGNLSGATQEIKHSTECHCNLNGCKICELFQEDQQNSTLKSQLEGQRRVTTPHLGRAEDCFVICREKLRIEKLEKFSEIHPLSIKHFIWIPKNVADKLGVGGVFYRVPTFYSLVNGRRLFRWVECFCNDGNIDIDPAVSLGASSPTLPYRDSFDGTDLPVFLTKCYCDE